jgi:hypothetical protein
MTGGGEQLLRREGYPEGCLREDGVSRGAGSCHHWKRREVTCARRRECCCPFAGRWGTASDGAPGLSANFVLCVSILFIGLLHHNFGVDESYSLFVPSTGHPLYAQIQVNNACAVNKTLESWHQMLNILDFSYCFYLSMYKIEAFVFFTNTTFGKLGVLKKLRLQAYIKTYSKPILICIRFFYMLLPLPHKNFAP